MESQRLLAEALSKYKGLKAKLGRPPSSHEFYYVFPKRVLADAFLGGNAYSRLQKEAGDEPNRFSSPKSSLGGVLVKWGILARETLKQRQKLPIQSDWNHKGLRPTVSGIEKSHRIKWSDIPGIFRRSFSVDVEWADVVQAIPLSDENPPSIGQAEGGECFVYLMKDIKTHSYKIGSSANPLYREKTLQSEKPKIELTAAKKYVNRKIAMAIEKALHETYSHKRRRGEWFDLDSDDVDEIRATLDDSLG